MIAVSASTLKVTQKMLQVTITTGTVLPLFVLGPDGSPDLGELKSKLRLSGVPSTADAQAMIEDAVTEARMRYIRRLTWARVQKLLSMQRVESPSGDNYLRNLASHVEVQLVRLILMERMPMAFLEASGSFSAIYEHEAPFRQLGRIDLDLMIERQEKAIEESMQLLAGEEVAGSETSIELSVIEPDASAVPALRSSIWKTLRS